MRDARFHGRGRRRSLRSRGSSGIGRPLRVWGMPWARRHVPGGRQRRRGQKNAMSVGVFFRRARCQNCAKCDGGRAQSVLHSHCDFLKRWVSSLLCSRCSDGCKGPAADRPHTALPLEVAVPLLALRRRRVWQLVPRPQLSCYLCTPGWPLPATKRQGSAIGRVAAMIAGPTARSTAATMDCPNDLPNIRPTCRPI